MNANARVASYREWLSGIRAVRWELLCDRYADAVRSHQGQRKAWAELHEHVNLMLREGM